MIIDPVVERLHRQREEHMERFGYDIEAIVRDIRDREASTSGTLLQPPKTPPPESSLQRSRYARKKIPGVGPVPPKI